VRSAEEIEAAKATAELRAALLEPAAGLEVTEGDLEFAEKFWNPDVKLPKTWTDQMDAWGVAAPQAAPAAVEPGGDQRAARAVRGLDPSSLSPTASSTGRVKSVKWDAETKLQPRFDVEKVIFEVRKPWVKLGQLLESR